MPKGKFTKYRGSMSEEDFMEIADQMQISADTVESLKRYFVNGEQPSKIMKNRQHMNNNIDRFVKRYKSLRYE